MDPLDEAVDASEMEHATGALVAFTDGTDRAGRVSDEAAQSAVDDSPHEAG